MKEFPAAIAVVDGQLYSGWVEAMWPNISRKGLPPDGLALDTIEGASQVTLSEVIASFVYWGN